MEEREGACIDNAEERKVLRLVLASFLGSGSLRMTIVEGNQKPEPGLKTKTGN